MCKQWRQDLEARGFCNKTVQLCLALAKDANSERLEQLSERLEQLSLERLNASTGGAERAFYAEANSFLTRNVGFEGTLRDWLQCASQEHAEGPLSRGAASTAQILGLPLVQWAGKQQGVGYPGMHSLTGQKGNMTEVAISPDGGRIVSAHYKFVKLWNAATGAEVRILMSHNVVMKGFEKVNTLTKSSTYCTVN